MTPSRLLPLAALLLLSSATSASAEDATRSANPLAALDEATLKGFVEQPLFEPSRRRPVVAPPQVYVAPETPPVPEPPPSMRLLGLVEGAHSLVAVVRRGDTGRTETLRPGDRIGGWVVQITPAVLRVVNGSRAFDYALFRGSPLQGPAAVDMPSALFMTPTVIARDPSAAPTR